MNAFSVILICRGTGLSRAHERLLHEHLGYLSPVLTFEAGMVHVRLHVRALSARAAEGFAAAKMRQFAEHVWLREFAVVDVHAAPVPQP